MLSGPGLGQLGSRDDIGEGPRCCHSCCWALLRGDPCGKTLTAWPSGQSLHSCLTSRRFLGGMMLPGAETRLGRAVRGALVGIPRWRQGRSRAVSGGVTHTVCLALSPPRQICKLGGTELWPEGGVQMGMSALPCTQVHRAALGLVAMHSHLHCTHVAVSRPCTHPAARALPWVPLPCSATTGLSPAPGGPPPRPCWHEQ